VKVVFELGPTVTSTPLVGVPFTVTWPTIVAWPDCASAGVIAMHARAANAMAKPVIIESIRLESDIKSPCIIVEGLPADV
jgi:hypothetical protein